MGDDWIRKLADDLKQQDEQQAKHDQLLLHESQVTAEKTQRLWDALVATVERDVHRFQEEFPTDRKKSIALENMPPDGFRVYRTEVPRMSLDVRLPRSGKQIAFRYHSTAGNEQHASEWSGTLIIRVAPDDTLYLNQYGRDFFDLDEVSQMFLERIFRGVLS